MCLCVYICKYVCMYACMYVLVYWYTYILQCLYALTITHNNSFCLHIYIYKRRRRIYCNCSALYLFWPFQGHSCLQKNYTDDLGVKKIDSVTDILNSYVHSASFSPMTSVPGHFRWKFTDFSTFFEDLEKSWRNLMEKSC